MRMHALLLPILVASGSLPLRAQDRTKVKPPQRWSAPLQGDTVFVHERLVACDSVEPLARLTQVSQSGDEEAVRNFLRDRSRGCLVLPEPQRLVVEAPMQASLRHPIIGISSARVHLLGSPDPLVVESRELRVPNREHDAVVRQFLLRNDLGLGGSGELSYMWALADLDLDGLNETIVSVSGSRECRAGNCQVLVLRSQGTSLELLGRIARVGEWVVAGSRGTGGWRELYVTVGNRERRTLSWSQLSHGTAGYPADATARPARILPDVPGGDLEILLRDNLEGERRVLRIARR